MVRNVKGEIRKKRKKGENQTEHVPGKRRRVETIRPKSFFDERMWKKFRNFGVLIYILFENTDL